MAKIKLTPAQLKLLQEGSGTFINTYKPGLKLIELKLVDSQAISYGQIKWSINEAGRAYLGQS